MVVETAAHLEREYDALRREIDAKLEHVARLDQFGLVASAGFWAWAVSTPFVLDANPLVAWIPTIMMLLTTMKVVSLQLETRHIGEYLAHLEDVIGLPRGVGWERRLREHRKRGRWRDIAGWAHRLMCFSVLMLNVALAIVVMVRRQ